MIKVKVKAALLLGRLMFILLTLTLIAFAIDPLFITGKERGRKALRGYEQGCACGVAVREN